MSITKPFHHFMKCSLCTPRMQIMVDGDFHLIPEREREISFLDLYGLLERPRVEIMAWHLPYKEPISAISCSHGHARYKSMFSISAMPVRFLNLRTTIDIMYLGTANNCDIILRNCCIGVRS